MHERFDALVIGAGFCGLGVGAALRAHGVSRFAILEQGDQVGHFWTKTYDRVVSRFWWKSDLTLLPEELRSYSTPSSVLRPPSRA
jgi:cation diffusion facilitator CzcD-associated flavoprotein CzcO